MSGLGTVYEKGDYIDLFRTSDLMITDGCSFLAEYLPTQKPLIRLINKKGIKLNEVGNNLVKGYYSSYSNEEFEKLFSELLINKNDSKKNIRKDLIDTIIDKNEKSTDKIFRIILEKLEKN